jgi:hypothetical protein
LVAQSLKPEHAFDPQRPLVFALKAVPGRFIAELAVSLYD